MHILYHSPIWIDLKMMIKNTAILACVLLVSACTGLIQTASISEAYKKYNLQEYEQTLELIARAENSGRTTPEMKAELAYLKARTHERLGQQDIARTLYEYVAEQHEDSQYGYLAGKKLSTKP